jgi:hypothetical protein
VTTDIAGPLKLIQEEIKASGKNNTIYNKICELDKAYIEKRRDIT